jgi:hypothetical protein
LKKWPLYFLFLFFAKTVIGQNTIGLPQVVNYGINDFRAGAQTWDIKQDKNGRMYFANNEGLITYDGNYWKLYPQPNKTILRSIALDGKNRIYAGGQDELGYYTPNDNGILQYKSLKNLIPVAYKKFTDVWDIEIFNGAIFFRTADKIFEYKNDAIQVYPATSVWQFMKLAGGKLFALDKQNGLFHFVNNIWQPLLKETPDSKIEITGIIHLAEDSFMLSSLQNGLYILSKGILTKKPQP